MKTKTFLLLIVAVGCGLMTMLGVQHAMQGRPAEGKIETLSVLVALENIDAGVRLTEKNTSIKKVPRLALPEDPLRTMNEATERAARMPIVAGEIIRKSKVTKKGEYGKSVAIPKGMRVLAISVDDTHTNSGLVRPGDRVDVLVTFQGKNGKKKGTATITKVLLEYVEVFATDNQTAMKTNDKSDSSRAKNVSLLLSPEQVNYVLLAQRKGSLSLAWRNRSDDELTRTKDIDEELLEELRGTVGLDEPYSSYEYESEADPELNPVVPEPVENDVNQFLNEMEISAPVEPVVETPRWKVEIYQGNTSVSSEFEIEQPQKKPETTAMKSSDTSLTDIVRAFLPKRN